MNSRVWFNKTTRRNSGVAASINNKAHDWKGERGKGEGSVSVPSIRMIEFCVFLIFLSQSDTD